MEYCLDQKTFKWRSEFLGRWYFGCKLKNGEISTDSKGDKKENCISSIEIENLTIEDITEKEEAELAKKMKKLKKKCRN